MVVDREEGQYLGHPSTVLLEDGRTMLAVYPKGHGRGAIVLKRSEDGGRTWSERLPVPASWATSLETPTIHRTIDPRTGTRRLVLFSGLWPARLAHSEDDGRTWSELAPIGDWGGIVVMSSCERLRDGRYLAMFHDDGRFFRAGGKATGTFTLYRTFSSDGGLTWSEPDAVWSGSDVHLCEPGLVRSPDGATLAVLLRENRRVRNSHVMLSRDEGETWSSPRELPAALTGDRHVARHAPDGRLFVSFRDWLKGSPTWGDWVGWVGTFDDLVAGREGQLRVRLGDNLVRTDCAYPGVEVLPDGTIVATTYGHWEEGEEPYVVSVRFRMEELDVLLRAKRDASLRAELDASLRAQLDALAREATPTPPRTQRPPNIVLVLADDLGYREVGAFGQEKIATPHVDRLAAEGAKLTRFYAASPVCAPSRCALLTGKHTGRAAIRGNKEIGGWGPDDPEGQWALPAAEVTLVEHLKTRGYATGAFGKWGLGGPGSEGHPCSQGFDAFFGYLCQKRAHNHTPTHLWRNHGVAILRENRWFAAHQRLAAPPDSEEGWARYRGGEYAPQRILDEAVTFVRAHAERPFFLYFPSALPHAALQAPQEWIDRQPRDWDAKPYLGEQGYLPTPAPRATYAAMIAFLDHSVGVLLATLRELGLEDDTIVLFTSDNGATFNGGVDRAFFASHGELRGHKTQLWEGGIRVPFVARWPGHIAAGSAFDAPATLADLLPTLLHLAGGADPELAGIDGASLAPLLLGAGPAPAREALYWEYPEGHHQQAVLLDGVWKAIRPRLSRGDLTIELYHLGDDPSESKDLAAAQPEIVARAERTMARAHLRSEVFPLKGVDD